jgi:hypothetical protein
MKNTGIEYLSTERTPTVLPELSELLPPLTDEQFSSLEADILQNGCYSPVITNEDLVVVDGHNRMDICEEHGSLTGSPCFTLRICWMPTVGAGHAERPAQPG